MNKPDIVIDIDQADMQVVFDVTEFLEVNKKELINDLKPLVSRFLEDQALFEGPFSLAFDQQFKEFIESELRLIIIQNFNLDAEKAMYLIEMIDLMGILDYYLDKGNYLE